MKKPELQSPEKLELRVKHGKVSREIATTLGRTLVNDWYAAISEFVRNSYDADAEDVFITIDSDRQALEISDDGSGMNENGLESFFRLGDSDKVAQPHSPIKKRKRIGKKGIAKTLLRYLGNSFSLETICGKELTVIDEGIINDDYVPGEVYPAPRDAKTGTVLNVRELNFKVGENFDVDTLCRKLEWSTPNKMDFDVFVNGRLIKKRGVVKYSSVYQVEIDAGDGNFARGRIYLRRANKKESPLEGVFICVNGGAVGDSSVFNLSEFDSRFEGNVQGEINADFLENAITLDRSKFKEDPRVTKVIKGVDHVLESMAYDLEQGDSRTRYSGSDPRVSDVVKSALEQAQEQISLRLEKRYEMVLSRKSEAGEIARLDEKSGRILLNGESSMFVMIHGKVNSNNLSEVYLKRAFLIAAAHAIAKYGLPNPEEVSGVIAQNLRRAFQDYSNIVNVAGKITGRGIHTPLEEIYFNPYRLYDHMELSSMTGRSARIIRLLHTSGALPGSEEHMFEKEKILGVLKKIDGRVSCIEAVDPEYSKTNVRLGGYIKIHYGSPRPTTLDVNLAKSGLDGLDILNVGVTHPLHFIPFENVDRFVEFVNQNNLYKK